MNAGETGGAGPPIFHRRPRTTRSRLFPIALDHEQANVTRLLRSPSRQLYFNLLQHTQANLQIAIKCSQWREREKESVEKKEPHLASHIRWRIPAGLKVSW
jgi:hypothetical protein